MNILASDPVFSFSFNNATCELTLTPNQIEGNHQWFLNGVMVSNDATPTLGVTPDDYVIQHIVGQNGQCIEDIAYSGLDIVPFELEDITHEVIDEAPLCPGDVVDVVFKYCFDSDPIEFILDAQLPVGINLGTGGDFVNGSATLNNFIEEEGVFCQSATLQVTIDETGTAGVSFPINMVISENCLINRPEFDFDLNVFDENLDAEFTFQIDEENCLLTLIPDDPANEHSWLIDGVEVSTETNPTLTVDPGVYSVAHVVTGECSSLEADPQSVDMADCGILSAFTCPCEGQGAINLDAGEGTTVSAFIASQELPSTSVSNTCLAIKGRLIVDTDFFIIVGGEVKMQPGSEIYVEPGNGIVLSNINQDLDGDGVAGMHGCGQLWEGVTAAATTPTEAGATVTVANCIIQDAVHALRLENGTQTWINGNTFDRNHIALYVPPSATLKYINQPVSPVRNNVFSCTSNLLPPYSGQVAITGDKARSGVEIHDLKEFQIGTPLIGNTFSGMAQGIFISNSNVQVLRAKIHDMYGAAPDSDFTDQGVGIYLTNKSWLDMRSSRFYNLETAVFGDHVLGIQADENGMGRDPANVSGNLIRGFDITPINNGLIVIEDNQIRTQQYGILVHNAAAAGILRIIENEGIVLKPSPYSLVERAAIKIQDALESNPGSNALLQGNLINIEEIGDGIVLSGISGVTLTGSEIVYESTVTTSASKYGILLSNANDNYLYDNYVQGASIAGNHHGIYIKGSVDNRLCCNTTTGTSFGIYFDGTCDGTRLRHNEFANNSFGLTCFFNTRIGVQNAAGNLWTGPFSSLAAAHYSPIQGDVFDSRFFVALPLGTSIWPDPNQVFVAAGADWFLSGGNAPNCTSDITCEEPDDANIIDEDFAIKVVRGQFSYGDYPVVSQWEAERSLYRNQKLADPQSSGTWSTELQQFFVQQPQQNSKLHAVGEVEDGLAALYEHNATVNTEQSILIQFTEQLFLLDSTYWDGGLDSISYLADRADLRLKIQNAYESINVATQSLVQNQISLAQLLSIDNANIALEHLALDNQMAVNDLYLQTIAIGEQIISPSQEQALLTIAEQCPYSGGHAVYRAQAILEHYEKVYSESTCATIQAMQAGNTDGVVPSTSIIDIDSNAVSTSEVTVYPNPTNGTFYINLPLNESLWNIEIINIKGTVLKELRDQLGSLQIDLSQAPAGLYLMRCTSEDQVVTKRIIVQ